MTTSSLITYECGCTMQRASFHDFWQREYICGAHKSTITSPSTDEPIADKVWKLADPAYTPDPAKWARHAEQHDRVTTVVNAGHLFTQEERNVVLAVLAIRQFEVQREMREVRRTYDGSETGRLRLEAGEAEYKALKSAIAKLQHRGPLA